MMPVFVWTLWDAVGLTVASIAIVLAIAVKSITLIRVLRCKHDGGINETGACDAICRKCGKNLGFIGAWRKAQACDAGEKA